MAGGGQLPGGFFLGNQGVDDPGVLTVNAADAPQGLQLLQGEVEVPVPQQHGGIGHVHLERRNALGEHLRQLRPDALVPVVDGHVEAVVAEGLSHGLLPPAGKAGGQGLPLVGAGEVNDGGGSPPEGRPASRGEAVGGDGARHLQVEVGVGVDEAGEKDAASHVDDPVRLRLEPPAQGDHLLPLHQQVRPTDALAGDNAAALKECAHRYPSVPQYDNRTSIAQLPECGKKIFPPGRFCAFYLGRGVLSWHQEGAAADPPPNVEEVKECRLRSSCPCCWRL